MKCLGRWVLNVVAALSLLLAIAICVVWARSYWVQDEPTFAGQGNAFFQLTSRSGDLVIDVAQTWPEDCRRWYSGAPDDHFGPSYVPSTGMNTERNVAGVKLVTGTFSIAMSNGSVLMEEHKDFPLLITLADGWPITRAVELKMPHGYYFVAFSVLPLAWAFSKLRCRYFARHRRRLGLCPSCGYDLRATADRCPECGTGIITGANQ
ncbi:MAG TPA: hypothetical protein VH370_26180 [Humisphaera sp.]|nr:hypothetical protein [Humisphaera sp.]